MAFVKIDARSQKCGRRMPDWPYVRVGRGQLSIHGKYLEQVGLTANRHYEIHIDRENGLIGLTEAKQSNDETARLLRTSGSNNHVLSSIAMTRSVGIGDFCYVTCDIKRKGKMTVIDTRKQFSERELKVG